MKENDAWVDARGGRATIEAVKRESRARWRSNDGRGNVWGSSMTATRRGGRWGRAGTRMGRGEESVVKDRGAGASSAEDAWETRWGELGRPLRAQMEGMGGLIRARGRRRRQIGD